MLLQKKLGIDLENQKQVVSDILDELLAEMPDDGTENASLARKLVSAKRAKKNPDFKKSNEISKVETRVVVDDTERNVAVADNVDENRNAVGRGPNKPGQIYRIPKKVKVRPGKRLFCPLKLPNFLSVMVYF